MLNLFPFNLNPPNTSISFSSNSQANVSQKNPALKTDDWPGQDRSGGSKIKKAASALRQANPIEVDDWSPQYLVDESKFDESKFYHVPHAASPQENGAKARGWGSYLRSILPNLGFGKSKVNDVARVVLPIKTPEENYQEGLALNEESDIIKHHSYGASWRKAAELKQQAIKVLKKAADADHIEAILLRAHILKVDIGNLPEAVNIYEEYIKKFPDNKNISKIYDTLAEIYQSGGQGVKKDEAKAVLYYNEAIKRNAQSKYPPPYPIYNLALLLEKGGVGFEQDLERAFNLLKSIASGYADAKCALARFYREGKHVMKNLGKAEQLYESIAYCHKESAYQLATLYEEHHQFQLAKEYYQKAYGLGHRSAEKALEELAQHENKAD